MESLDWFYPATPNCGKGGTRTACFRQKGSGAKPVGRWEALHQYSTRGVLSLSGETVVESGYGMQEL